MHWQILVLLLVVVLALYNGTTRRRLHRRLAFGDGLTHRITVEPDADGRPGETLMAPSDSLYLGAVKEDGTRSDFAVMLSRHFSALVVVCLGPSSRDDLASDAAFTFGKLAGTAMFTPLEEPTPDVLLGEPALRYSLGGVTGGMLTEWKLDHGGWRYVIDVHIVRGDGEEQRRLAQWVLSTWRWLEPPASP